MTEGDGTVEVVIPLDPLIGLLHLRHTYTSHFSTGSQQEAAKAEILDAIFARNMRPFYSLVCDIFGWPMDKARANEMDVINIKAVEEIEKRLADAKEHSGDIEIREALLAKCDHYASIGDYDRVLD